MPRLRTVPDATIYAAIRAMLAAEGEKAVAFGSVARVIGLAASTLVQRYGSRDGMVRAALLDAWDRLDATTTLAEGEEGATGYLKALGSDSHDAAQLGLLVMDFRDPELQVRAAHWRARVEDGLARRLGGGAKARESAAMLFAAWQGQALWDRAGGKTFKIKDAVKRLD